MDDDSRSVRDLREANRHMREFLAMVVHELCNPLAAIRYALYILEQQGENASTQQRF